MRAKDEGIVAAAADNNETGNKATGLKQFSCWSTINQKDQK